MSEYLKTVITSVFAISTLSVFFPKDSFGKYANLLSGIIVMSILLIPVLNTDDVILQELPGMEEIEVNENRYLMDEFEKELSKRVERKLKDTTGRQFSVTAYASYDGETVEIEGVEIEPFSKEYAAVVSDYLAIEEEKITGR